MSVADLMSRIEEARGGHQRASDLFADAKAMFEPEEPPPPPEGGGGMSASDVGHLALDIAGFIPVVGTAADLVNAGWYAAEGDYKNAALSAAAAIPGAGDAAAATKLGVKAVDAAQAVKRGAEAYETAEGVAEGANQLEDGDYGGAGVALGAAAFGAGGGRGRHNNRSGDSDEYDDYAERYGYGPDDYEDSRERNYGNMGRNQRENRQFDAAQREAERRAGREFTRDERRQVHDRDPEEGNERGFGEIVDGFGDVE